MREEVILVDVNNKPVGTAEKMAAHREGRLHRAFSIFLFNPRGQLLLQKRASEKYHSGGLWSNTCCGHPRPGETVIDAAHRRLREELGVDCPLLYVSEFVYRVEFHNGLTEHEYDCVLAGRFEGVPTLNPDEVADWKWMHLRAIAKDLQEHPDSYTYWFRTAIEREMLGVCMEKALR